MVRGDTLQNLKLSVSVEWSPWLFFCLNLCARRVFFHNNKSPYDKSNKFLLPDYLIFFQETENIDVNSRESQNCHLYQNASPVGGLVPLTNHSTNMGAAISPLSKPSSKLSLCHSSLVSLSENLRLDDGTAPAQPVEEQRGGKLETTLC